MKKYPKYKTIELNNPSGNPSGYFISVYNLNKKSVSCKIARNGNFDPCSKKLNVKICDGKILFVYNFESLPIDKLELIDD